jgi:hypothetical protein
MPDNVDALLRLSEEQHPDSKSHRRRVMAGIVQAMIDLAGGGGVRDEVHQHTAIMQLTAIISNMTDKVAEADDATFRQSSRRQRCFFAPFSGAKPT